MDNTLGILGKGDGKSRRAPFQFLEKEIIDRTWIISYYKVRLIQIGKIAAEANMPTSTLTSKGQMVIPKTIRDRLKLEPGDRLDFIIQEDGGVLIRPVSEDVHSLKGLLHRPGRAAVSVEKMNQVIRERRKGK